jgi:hypothetical protein
MRELVNNFNLKLGILRFVFILNIILILYNLLTNPTLTSINILLFSVIEFYLFGDIIAYLKDNPEILDLIPDRR